MSELAKDKQKKLSINEENLQAGRKIIEQHPLFGELYIPYQICGKGQLGKQSAAKISREGNLYLNKDVFLTPKQWAYVIAHGYLHLAFGHFDAEKMPGYDVRNEDGTITHKVEADLRVWNLACDIYITKFLQDMKFGESFTDCDLSQLACSFADERKIYQYLLEQGITGEEQDFGTASASSMDMIGLEKPKTYAAGKQNSHARTFAMALSYAVKEAVGLACGQEDAVHMYRSAAERAREWFITNYPLLGGIASGLRIVEEEDICYQEGISIAAIDSNAGEIYLNPAAQLSFEELKFVIAHELLHAGLSHRERCQGRDLYLWNVACDYVINGWLCELAVGEMPEGVLYDAAYAGWNAEGIYDELVLNLRKHKNLKTFRGYGAGDLLDRGGHASGRTNGISLDEFCKSALAQGLEYHQAKGRGTIPAGLIEEIRALSMPPIAWDVQLAHWFSEHIPPLAKHRSYARPSRRQGATPDIPRAGYVTNEPIEHARTFGVVIDTSGSMSAKLIGMALGSIASYATSRDVPFARIVFCDAHAYDAGYLALDEIAGRVEVKGRGGTKLQPGIDLLETAKDFPKTGPILIITDGEIEGNLSVHRKHAYLLPKGRHLPFQAKGEVFYFE